MSRVIPVKIRDRIAQAEEGFQYICGNSDFMIAFNFDDEWDEYDVKTARFTYEGQYQDVPFSGNACAVPVISNTHSFRVGVFSGNLRTTTAAYVPAKKSILCNHGTPAPPRADVYAQIMEMLGDIKENSGVSDEQIEAALNKYLEENPIEGGGIDEEQLDKAVQDALKEAKESGEFDGAPGKDGKDADVTQENVTKALGYTPAKQEDVASLFKEMEKLSEETWTFTLEDGTTLTKKVFVNA